MNTGRVTPHGFVPADPSVESILARVGMITGNPTLNGKDSYPDAVPEISNERKDLIEAYVQVFATPAGQKVLEDLLDQTLRRAVFATGSGKSIEEVTLNRVFRDGQSNIVCHVLRTIADGQKLAAGSKRKSGNKRS